jgi:hypothetical protein
MERHISSRIVAWLLSEINKTFPSIASRCQPRRAGSQQLCCRFLVSPGQYNKCMNRCAGKITLRRSTPIAGTTMLCIIAGCWQEIEYTGPDPVASRAASAQQASTNQSADEKPVADVPATPNAELEQAASGFADDLANALSTETAGPTETYASDKSSSPTVDPYALPFETTQGEQTADIPDAVPETPGSVETSPPADGSNEPLPAESQPAETAVKSTRLDAWLLGSHLSLAALANDRGVAAQNVQRWLESAKLHAGNLGVTLGDLPAAAAAANSQTTSRQVLSYLLVEGQQVGRELTEKHGADHAALVEVAVKSNLLRVLYSPGSAAAEAISTAISQAAPRAELAPHLWQPLVDMVAAKADAAEVRKAVQKFHADVEQHLSPAVEQ